MRHQKPLCCHYTRGQYKNEVPPSSRDWMWLRMNLNKVSPQSQPFCLTPCYLFRHGVCFLRLFLLHQMAFDTVVWHTNPHYIRNVSLLWTRWESNPRLSSKQFVFYMLSPDLVFDHRQVRNYQSVTYPLNFGIDTRLISSYSRYSCTTDSTRLGTRAVGWCLVTTPWAMIEPYLLYFG